MSLLGSAAARSSSQRSQPDRKVPPERKASSPWIPATFVFLNWVVLPATFLFFYEEAFLFVAWCLAASSLLLIVNEWRLSGSPLTPVGLIGLTCLVIFSLRPMAIASAGVTTAGAAIDTRTLDGLTYQASYLALIQVWLFLCVFGSAYFALAADNKRPRASVAPRVRINLSPTRCALILLGCMILAVGCSLIIVVGSGGLASYMSGLSVRSSFLAGRFFLTLGYVPLAVSLFLYVLARGSANKRIWNPLALVGLSALIVSAFLTGARGPVMLSVLIPLVLMKQLGKKPISSAGIILIGAAALVASMVMSVVLRDNVYDGGQAIQNLGDDPLGFFLDRLTSGMETRPFDSLIVLNEAYLSDGLQWQLGVTYLAVGTWFLPSSLAPWKSGGGNAWFTEEYLPRFYYPDHIETSISAIGEAFANFGWLGVVILGGVLAGVATRAARQPAEGNPRAALRYVLLTPLFFSLVRGDAYQNLSIMALIAVLANVFVRFGQESAPLRHAPLKGVGHSEGTSAVQSASRRLA